MALCLSAISFGPEQRLLRGRCMRHGGRRPGVISSSPFQRRMKGSTWGEHLRLHIEDHSGDKGAKAHLFCGLGGGIREVVHVTVAGDAEANQLQAAQLHPPSERPSSVILASRGQIFSCSQGISSMSSRIAAQQRHGQVGVAV